MCTRQRINERVKMSVRERERDAFVSVYGRGRSSESGIVYSSDRKRKREGECCSMFA